MILTFISQEGLGIVILFGLVCLNVVRIKKHSIHGVVSLLGMVVFAALTISNTTENPFASPWRLSLIILFFGIAALMYVAFILALTGKKPPVFFPVLYSVPAFLSLLVMVLPHLPAFIVFAVLTYIVYSAAVLAILFEWRRESDDDRARRDAEWTIMLHFVFIAGMLISIARLFNWFTWLIAFWYFVLYILLSVLKVYDQPVNWENRAIMDNILDLVIILDKKGKIVRVNRRGCVLTGYSPLAVSGLPFEKFVFHVELTESNKLEWLARYGSEDTGTLSLRSPSLDGSIITASGEAFPADIRIIRLKDSTRESYAYIVIATDMRITRQLIKEISDREYAARDLALSESKFSRMFIFNPAGILIIDVKTLVISDVNPSMEEILEAETSALNGKKLTDIGLDMGSRGLPGFLETLEIEGSVPEFEARLTCATGKKKQCRVSAVVFNLNNSQSMLLSLTDVTVEEQMRDALARKQKMETIGLLAGGIAHDFNNILAVILGYLGLARRQSTEKIINPLHKAEEACLRAREITGQLLAFSRGGKPLSGVCDTFKLITESVSLVLNSMPIQSSYDMDEDVWSLYADRIQIGQVISNLAMNGIEASGKDGVMRIGAHNRDLRKTPESERPKGVDSKPLNPGLYVEITVEDNGPGIPEDIRPRIFDPFFTTKENGTGLGLSIVYSVIQNHGGAIYLDCPDGGGTIFHVWLQAVTDFPKPGTVPGDLFIPEVKRVLVLDDDDDVRESTAGLLESFGYTVDQYSDGENALAAYAKALDEGVPFDFCVLDLVIPGGMGGAACARLMLDKNPDAALIVSSGYSDDPVLSRFREYGFRAILPKPYTPEEMIRAITTVLAHSRE